MISQTAFQDVLVFPFATHDVCIVKCHNDKNMNVFPQIFLQFRIQVGGEYISISKEFVYLLHENILTILKAYKTLKTINDFRIL